jgi:hypothetical protein
MHDTTVANHRNLADDILWGVDGPNGIVAFLGISARRCYYLIESGAIPVNKLGHRMIVGSRSELRRLFGRAAAGRST